MIILTALALGAIGAVVAWLWRAETRHRQTRARLALHARGEGPETPTLDAHQTRAPAPTFPRRYRWLPFVASDLVFVGLWLGVGLPFIVAMAFAFLVAVLVHLAEEALAGARIARIETQLSEAIDLLVSALRAGAALLSGFEVALRETRPPLRAYVQDVVGRVRLGDDPREVILALPELIPLETFQLFAVSLAVHWDAGGSLASTLATVGRTIRDRIELDRRVRAQGIEAHASSAAVLAIAYLLAYLMWRANPERVEAFVLSSAGTQLVALVVSLQAIGLLWMSRISRSGF